jgi:hypothetical protein
MNKSRTYRIIRIFDEPNMPQLLVKTGLSNREAASFINTPETASSTARGKEAVRFTETYGKWCDVDQREDISVAPSKTLESFIADASAEPVLGGSVANGATRRHAIPHTAPSVG